MWCRTLAAGLLALLAACSAPDYTPVRDWARSASLAADYPAAAQGVPPPADDGILAMQEALVTWLYALGRMADDGVLPYMEDPFVDLAARAARTDARGGAAVAGLGRTLRHATRNNLQAPALRDTIRGTDAMVQALVVALKDTVMRAPAAAPEEAAPPAPAGTRRTQRPTAVPPPDTVAQDRAAVRARYAALLTQIAEGYAMLKARAGDITDDDTVQRIRAAEDQLRRAARTLPLPIAPLPAAPSVAVPAS